MGHFCSPNEPEFDFAVFCANKTTIRFPKQQTRHHPEMSHFRHRPPKNRDIMSHPLSTFHSPLSTFHFPFSTLHSPLSTLHSPLSTLHSSLSTFHSPLSSFISHLSSFISESLCLCLSKTTSTTKTTYQRGPTRPLHINVVRVVLVVLYNSAPLYPLHRCVIKKLHDADETA